MCTRLDSTEWNKIQEVELVYKSKVKPSQRPKVNSSKEAYDLFLQTWNENTLEIVEEFKVMYLNRGNKVLNIYPLSVGGITSTVADPRIIYAVALKILAVNLILCHNHPSGNLQPSKADEELTSKVKEAGKYHDIKVIDSLIVTRESYFSFTDEGIL